MGSIKLKFDQGSLANPGWLGIGGVFSDHFGTIIRVLSKPTCQGLAIDIEILAFLEGLL